FRNRMIAKFAIPQRKRFWGSGFEQIPETALYPRSDVILDLCNALKDELREELGPGQLGEFITEWSGIEEYLLENAREQTKRNVSVPEAIRAFEKRGLLSSDQAILLDSLRKYRNEVVHQPRFVSPGALEEQLSTIRNLSKQLLKPRKG